MHVQSGQEMVRRTSGCGKASAENPQPRLRLEEP